MDVGEQNNLAAEEPARTKTMAARLKAWLEEVGASYPKPNPKYDAELAARQQEQIRTRGINQLEQQAAGFLEADYDPKNRWWGSAVED